jgi:hypothetical protein
MIPLESAKLTLICRHDNRVCKESHVLPQRTPVVAVFFFLVIASTDAFKPLGRKLAGPGGCGGREGAHSFRRRQRGQGAANEFLLPSSNLKRSSCDVTRMCPFKVLSLSLSLLVFFTSPYIVQTAGTIYLSFAACV